MHSLVYKRLHVPKRMEGEIDEDLFSASRESPGDSTSACQSCSSMQEQHKFAPMMSVPDSLRHSGSLPHSSTCNYGMQALINNVHRGYVNEELDHGSEQRKKPGGNPRQESELLRQWKRRKEAELQEREKASQAKQDKILEKATIKREDFYKEREAHVEGTKKLNREVETKENAELEAQQKLVEGNPWKAVALLLDLNGEAAAEGKGSGKIKSPRTSSVVELSTPRTQESKQQQQQQQQQRSREFSPKPPIKKTADLSRMREILLKLQNESLVR